MYSDYQQTGTSAVSAISKRLPQTASLPLFASSFIIVRDSSGLNAETSRPCVLRCNTAKRDRCLLAPMKTEEKSTTNFFPETILKHRPRRLRRP